MDLVIILATIANIVATLWVLVLGGKTVTEVIGSLRKRQPSKISPRIVPSLIFAAVVLVLITVGLLLISSSGSSVLNNPIWQFIGVIIAVIFGMIGYGSGIKVFRLQRNRKEIVWETISNTSILPSVSDNLKGHVQFLFKGKQISDASIVTLRIRNTGNVPILPNDFEGSISFDFDTAEVLDAEVLETAPMSLKGKVKVGFESGRVFLRPVLLNSRDSITLKVLLSGSSGKINLNARIAGVKQIAKYA